MLAQIEYYTLKSSDNHVNHRVADISLNSLYRRAIYTVIALEWCIGSRVPVPSLHPRFIFLVPVYLAKPSVFVAHA